MGGIFMAEKLNNKELNQLALEVISFLKEWGLWRDSMILTAGNKYSYSSHKEDKYEGMTNVSLEEKVDPETYTRGLTNAPGGNADLIWRSLANPEHIFDMVYEGPLHMLLRYDAYEPDLQALPDSAWKYIFANTDMIADHILAKHDVEDPFDLGMKMWNELFDNPERSYWDPLVFDSWEEYLEMYGSDDGEKAPAYTDTDTYEEYRYLMEGGADLYIKEHQNEISTRWERMEEEAIAYFMDTSKKDGAQNSEIYEYLQDGVKEHVINGFCEIFERYGLWYDLDYSWSLSCYYR